MLMDNILLYSPPCIFAEENKLISEAVMKVKEFVYGVLAKDFQTLNGFIYHEFQHAFIR